MNTTFTIARLRASVPSDSPARIAGLERVIDGLRKAELSEPRAAWTGMYTRDVAQRSARRHPGLKR